MRQALITVGPYALRVALRTPEPYRGAVTGWTIQGKTALITGANTGIGRITALELARQGAHVVLAGRSRQRTEPVLADIRNQSDATEPAFVELDLADLDSVRSAAHTYLERHGPLHVLVNNAGLAGHRGQTKDGFELAFGVNHLGPYLLTRILLPRLLESRPARIINVASKAHYRATELDWVALTRSTATITGLREYERSKLANVLFTKSLARAFAPHEIATWSVHPGVVASDIWRRVPRPVRWFMKRNMITNEEGAEGSLLLATARDPGAPSGAYFSRTKPKDPNPIAEDERLQDELWARSASWVGLPTRVRPD
jgi:retinol dehydrogenase-12